MRICITGACGHIGSALLESFGEEHEITVVDNMSAQRYPSLFGRNIRFYHGDVLDPDVYKYIQGSQVCIHLAAITDAASSFGNPDAVHKVNLLGTKNVAKACASVGSRMIFPSTTSVYGSQSDVVDESCHELRPQSPYAQSKLLAEQAIRTSDCDFTILRLGTIFGPTPGMRFHTAVNKFVWQSVVGDEITVWRGALLQKRPYLHIFDCVSAIRHVTKHLAGPFYDIGKRVLYNVVTGNHCPRDILDIIADYRKMRVDFVDHSILNQLSYNVSADKLRLTGWNPTRTLRDGIEATLELFKEINTWKT
jgi:UDP-glucose 4-epimerase